ncbi:hypothetical protein VUR80DRAFT_1898 [Thermomyces stellatus]
MLRDTTKAVEVATSRCSELGPVVKTVEVLRTCTFCHRHELCGRDGVPVGCPPPLPYWTGAPKRPLPLLSRHHDSAPRLPLLGHRQEAGDSHLRASAFAALLIATVDCLRALATGLTPKTCPSRLVASGFLVSADPCLFGPPPLVSPYPEFAVHAFRRPFNATAVPRELRPPRRVLCVPRREFGEARQAQLARRPSHELLIHSSVERFSQSQRVLLGLGAGFLSLVLAPFPTKVMPEAVQAKVPPRPARERITTSCGECRRRKQKVDMSLSSVTAAVFLSAAQCSGDAGCAGTLHSGNAATVRRQ